MLSALHSELSNHASWVAPQGGFFIGLNLNAEIDAHALLAQAAVAGVTYVPGSASRLDRMEKGVRRLAKVLRDSTARAEKRVAR